MLPAAALLEIAYDCLPWEMNGRGRKRVFWSAVYYFHMRLTHFCIHKESRDSLQHDIKTLILMHKCRMNSREEGKKIQYVSYKIPVPCFHGETVFLSYRLHSLFHLPTSHVFMISIHISMGSRR